MKHTLGIGIATLYALGANSAQARPLEVDMHALSGPESGKSLGRITIRNGSGGAVFTPHLTDLPPGRRGFHVHEHGNCAMAMDMGQAVAGGAAGGHWDGMAGGSMASAPRAGVGATLGDLPDLLVGADGTATTPVIAPRIRAVDDLVGKALMIHEATGARMACGVIARAVVRRSR